MREPLPVWYLGIFLISFTSILLAIDKLLTGHGWNPDGITVSFFQPFSKVAFVFVAIALEIFTFKFPSHWGYPGIIISFLIWLVASWALMTYVIG